MSRIRAITMGCGVVVSMLLLVGLVLAASAREESSIPTPAYARHLSRPSPANAAPATAPADKPDASGIVMLSDLEDLYAPVPFDHAGHARMAGMSQGCTVCHHHTPQGEDHPACRSCHSTSGNRNTIGMPGLKGAYHRQCLNCHSEWSHDTDCNACHVAKPRRGVPSAHDAESDMASVMGRMGPCLKAKDTFVYDTGLAGTPVVTFHHRDHAQTFGVRCEQCHAGDSCGRCHDAGRPLAATSGRPSMQHVKTSCMTCHNEDRCTLCHDQNQRPAFDHAINAGWSLAPHHTGVKCRACHGEAADFSIPTRTCHACHAKIKDHEVRPEGAPMVAARMSGAEQADVDCVSCHKELQTRFAHATTIHGPAGDKTGCGACHNTTDAFSPKANCGGQRELCLNCHNRPIDVGRGRTVTDIKTLLAENPNHHGPIRDGNCTACHDPHASDQAHLLVRTYATGFYSSFDVGRYALCYGCHNQDQVMSESGTSVTGFRQGDRNLHWLHVNRGKGRTCSVCHEIHASNRPFHIRDSVPFGESNWKLPINFEKTANGGSCAPGCHAAKSYDRSRTTQ